MNADTMLTEPDMCNTPITIEGRLGPIRVACKQCLQCRINRQSGLSLQALLEQRMTLCADFLTLTYETQPEQLDYRDCSNFLKLLRKWNLEQGNPLSIRYLAVGEYGSKNGRPHFHLIVYNSKKFPDTRPELEALRTRLWPHGFWYIGTVTPGSIRYTARYCLKFNEKGREGLAHWSKKPALGDAGMRELARYMRNRGDEVGEAPTVLSIDGKKYFVNSAMKASFEKGWGEPLRAPNALTAHMRWALDLKLGDPTEAQRKMIAEKQRFYESARFVREKL